MEIRLVYETLLHNYTRCDDSFCVGVDLIFTFESSHRREAPHKSLWIISPKRSLFFFQDVDGQKYFSPKEKIIYRIRNFKCLEKVVEFLNENNIEGLKAFMEML